MEKLPTIPSPRGTAFREFRITVLPFLTFAVVVAATALVWRQYIGPSSLVGEVQTSRSAVVSTVPARVSVIKVRLLDRVAAGQPVAEVVPADPRHLEAQAALTRARLELVRASIDPHLRKENNLINFAKLRLDWLNARAELASERAQLGYWENEIERIRQLAHVTNSAPLVSISGLESAEAQAKSFRGQVAEHSTLVREIGASLEQFDPEEKQMDAQFASSIQAAIAVEQRALDAIESQLNPVVLLSPVDGFVSSIGHNPGESILAGDPILVVSSAKSERIVAYVRQPIRLEMRPGMSVEVRSRSLSRAIGEAKVIGVGQQLEPILPELVPVKIGSGASAIEYGQPILVAVPPGLKIMPGEIVDLRPIPGTP